MKSINLVTVKNVLLTEYRCQLQVYVSVSLRAHYFLWQIKYQLLSSLHLHYCIHQSPCPQTSSPCPQAISHWLKNCNVAAYKCTRMQCCPRRKSFSWRILEDQFTSPCPQNSSPCPVLRPQVLDLRPQSPRKVSRTSHSANSPLCMHVKSINSVTVKFTDVRYYLLMSVSKPFFTVTQCCCPCPWGPIYKYLSLSSDFKSLSFPGIISPRPCPRALSPWTSSPWQHHC